MGQTLTHGVYLPDEGERNCYSGLAANWQILDTSVGTIAANTAALAGKAPAVHTHTKSQITDFPAFGNAAGTICEGNDSRLSDARTPTAHTHTKSDVTDLLNSNFIPSANNSYDLGSSSYQWNNVYAKRVNTQTLNGINPGALSLPDYTLAKMDLIDFSQWSVSGQRNEYTPVSDGWLFINIKDTASNSIFIYAHSLYNTDPAKATDYSASCFGNGSQGMAGRIAVMLPVRAGIVYGIIIKAASVSEIFSAKFYPALGNV